MSTIPRNLSMMALLASTITACEAQLGSPSRGGSDPLAADALCREAAAPAPMRRLSPVEYDNSIRDLFPGVEVQLPDLPPDAHVKGFNTLAEGQGVSPLLLERYNTAAEAVGKAAVEGAGRWAPCPLEADSGDAALDCAREIARLIASRAYRRPLEDHELTRYEAFIDESAAEFDARAAVELFIRMIVATPKFERTFASGDKTRVKEAGQPHNDFLNTVANYMGLGMDRYGNPECSNGPIEGVLR